jgi:predicted AlkP superfamily pyrophosphatase or phosphodiesterase
MKKLSSVLLFILFVSFSVVAQKPITDLKPTVVLISIDGFRYDYPEIYKPKTLLKLAANGVRAKWMTPSFPTKTFPNHYTIATGLLPQNHGIVDNNIYDPEFDAVFTLGTRAEVQNGRWWQGEPIWVTAEKQGQTAGAFFFPGTEAPIRDVRPTFWKGYDGKISNDERVETVLGWFDLPVGERPTILTMYFSDVDDAGHGFSPNSEETREAVKTVDKALGKLLKGLKKRKIDKKVNLIIVSDHGMMPVEQKNVVILDEMFDVKDAARIFWVSEIVQIFPKDGKEDEIYDSIKAKLPAQAKIYRKSEIPERFQYRDHRRIAPILVLPQEGWRIMTRERFEKNKTDENFLRLRGSHGYDNELESMRAIFIAYGPAFKKAYSAEPFQNIEVYNLMCAILGLEPAENDGNFETVRDMLK